MKKVFVLIVISLLWAASLQAQNTPTKFQEEILTNDSIITLIEAGLDEDLVITKIQTSKTNFDVSTDALINLKNKGVSKRIIQAMVNPHSPPVAEKTETGPVVDEIGFYLMESDKLIQILATGFDQMKRGNVLGSAYSFGLHKTKVKALLNGPRASVRTKNKRPEFFLYAPEGSSPADYIVIKLEKKDKDREVVIGSGAFSAKAGFEDKNLVQFSNTKLATRKYSLKFEKDLNPGEYCFYPIAGLQVGGDSVAANGKVYDFGIDE